MTSSMFVTMGKGWSPARSLLPFMSKLRQVRSSAPLGESLDDLDEDAGAEGDEGEESDSDYDEEAENARYHALIQRLRTESIAGHKAVEEAMAVAAALARAAEEARSEAEAEAAKKAGAEHVAGPVQWSEPFSRATTSFRVAGLAAKQTARWPRRRMHTATCRICIGMRRPKKKTEIATSNNRATDNISRGTAHTGTETAALTGTVRTETERATSASGLCERFVEIGRVRRNFRTSPSRRYRSPYSAYP